MQRYFDNLQSLLDIPFVRWVRRNHGLEHATIHLLSQHTPGLKIVGRSDAGGFWIYGNVSTENVQDCATRALSRMRKGEHQLAIHPNCGTNLVTAAVLGTVATLAALVGSDRERFGKLQRIPLIVLALIMALVLGQPLGMRIQQHITTLGNPSDLEITEVKRIERGKMTVHRIETSSS